MPLVVRFKQLFKKMHWAFLISLLNLLVWNTVYAENSLRLSKVNKLKASYLYNFTKFIEWQNLGSDELSPSIRICVDNTSYLFQFLEQLVVGQRVGKLKQTLEILPVETASGCELLFVSEGSKKITRQLDNTVIVADSASITFPGIAVVFYIKKSKLRFEIDLKKINSLNVVVSSELLKLASIK
ncbi:MAG: hypothetical protein ACI9VT_000845 [Psychroserpens sp.]|jgi:hypothetical protein